ncbi:hypothetical protein VC83_01095 [Pseudogymnoascus destructans]|nr:uncharacterized protein VC83_01095 [Pseudogymnoascus destructans]OAF62281.2 hypothetical protein VC83_01095 [Pseudogymnoascus destructans]
MLRFSMGIYKREREKSDKMARDILNLFSGSDCIAMPETDLDFLEDGWTGDMSAEARASTSSNSTTFYVFVEFPYNEYLEYRKRDIISSSVKGGIGCTNHRCGLQETSLWFELDSAESSTMHSHRVA